MARRGNGEREGGALKTALVVLGGLGLAWLTMETAFKPFLDSFRGTMNRSDPARDPDDDDDDGKSGGVQASQEEEPKEGEIRSSD